MEGRCLTVGPVQENCWIVWQEGSERALVIDPGEEAPRILPMLLERGQDARRLLPRIDHQGALRTLLPDDPAVLPDRADGEIGRASCRERV